MGDVDDRDAVLLVELTQRAQDGGAQRRIDHGNGLIRDSVRSRENGSDLSGPAITDNAATASSTVSENTDTQSSVRQAGTTPAVGMRPRLGFNPTILLSIAGTRPEPAVSVPSASGTRPAETATPDPELDPPGIRSLRIGLTGMP